MACSHVNGYMPRAGLARPKSWPWPGPGLKPWPWALDSADKISEWYLNRHHNAVIQQQSYLIALSLVDYDAGLGFVHLIDQ